MYMEEEIAAMDGSDDVRLDIPSLAATIQTKVNQAPKYSRRRCIYRVPNRLRRTNEQAYTPALVSIGPLHHNDERFVPMEAHKVKYLQSFLGDSPDLLNKCLRIVKAQETEIRECYADPIDLSSEQFCEMVLTDNAFIIQYFRNSVYDDINKEDDYVHGNLCMETTVFRDIQLEENQLPFFILDQLYNAAFQTNATSESAPSFTELACKVLFRKRKVNAKVGESQYYHLLHLVAHHHQPSEADEPRSDSASGHHRRLSPMKQPLLSAVETPTEDNQLTIRDYLFPQATKLDEANVKFEANDEKSSNLLDVKYDKGVLRMTKFFVDEDTECIHRNLIAFEQCHYHYGGNYDRRYFTDYHMFMNNLVNTPDDVQLLVEEGIIQNMIGSHEEVCDLINSLDTHAFTDFEAYHYRQTSVDLKNHCNNRWNRYRAMLIHDYFSNPWAAISVFAAVLLLLLTIASVVAAYLAIA